MNTCPNCNSRLILDFKKCPTCDYPLKLEVQLIERAKTLLNENQMKPVLVTKISKT